LQLVSTGTLYIKISANGFLGWLYMLSLSYTANCFNVHRRIR